ncbi:hypothetical protein SOVF_033030 [Spinacia oleracea]|nr:hypothetical protein SOVF_033030 [Spinacia oleracea]
MLFKSYDHVYLRPVRHQFASAPGRLKFKEEIHALHSLAVPCSVVLLCPSALFLGQGSMWFTTTSPEHE